ncbi:MAG: sulfur oxidation c-type cytochrome SoxA, partial [Gammaproteobacteria bacterium]|nr:sulfur oxidation c-type cytochrome SoxA [Gammaproteobacteria bacterium]
MRNFTAYIVITGILCGFAFGAQASPESDRKAFVEYYKKKFPKVKKSEYVNGVYAIDAASRAQWESIEEFPPYEIFIDEGETLFKKKFKNGKSLASCFPDYKKGIAQTYPQWDSKRKMVVTLPLAINECLKKNGEEEFEYNKGKIASVLAYLGFLSRGKTISVKVPNKDARAAYEDGKKFYYTRRGQLNMACAHCHLDNAGKRIRADILSPALGHTSHFPVYRA